MRKALEPTPVTGDARWGGAGAEEEGGSGQGPSRGRRGPAPGEVGVLPPRRARSEEGGGGAERPVGRGRGGGGRQGSEGTGGDRRVRGGARRHECPSREQQSACTGHGATRQLRVLGGHSDQGFAESPAGPPPLPVSVRPARARAPREGSWAQGGRPPGGLQGGVTVPASDFAFSPAAPAASAAGTPSPHGECGPRAPSCPPTPFPAPACPSVSSWAQLLPLPPAPSCQGLGLLVLCGDRHRHCHQRDPTPPRHLPPCGGAQLHHKRSRALLVSAQSRPSLCFACVCRRRGLGRGRGAAGPPGSCAGAALRGQESPLPGPGVGVCVCGGLSQGLSPGPPALAPGLSPTFAARLCLGARTGLS